MLRVPHVIPQSPPPLAVEPALSKQGNVVLLDDYFVMDMYNISFDEFQKRIVQAWRNHFLDDQVSPTFIRERVIVSGTRKHPTAIVESSLAYAGE